jgi:single-stranded DNA-binding protein
VRTGDRVVVTGLLRLHTWRTEQGEERTRLEVDAQTVGFDLSRSRVVQERGAPAAPSRDVAGADGQLEEVAPDDLSDVVPAQVGAGTGAG